MVINEGSRHDLHNGLEEVLGSQRATALMELLPPVGWADVATKRDLDHLADRMEARVLGEISNLKSMMIVALCSHLIAMVGVVFAAARFA